MATIVGVHGIGQQFKGPESLRAEWYPALCDGILLAGGQKPATDDLRCAFYGDLFRGLQVALEKLPASPAKKGGEAIVTQRWQVDDEDLQFIEAFAEIARKKAVAQPSPVPAQHVKKSLGSLAVSGALHLGLDKALQWLTSRPWMGTTLEAAVITDIKQVRAYLCDKPKGLRQQARQRVMAAIHPEETRIVIAHSLGSVVAWEALCAMEKTSVDTFITIGSPLGMKELIHGRLKPTPVNGRASWPGKVRQWINLADHGDIVATEHVMKERFAKSHDGQSITDVPVSNGWGDPHSAVAYLTAAATGQAISSASLTQ